MKPPIIFLRMCLICLALTVAGCSGAVPSGGKDPNWVETPSAQGTNWTLYMDTHGGGR